VDLDEFHLAAQCLVDFQRAGLEFLRVGGPDPGQGLDQVSEGLAFSGEVGGLAGQVQRFPVEGFCRAGQRVDTLVVRPRRS
jgi:hypothetical protein